MTHSLQKQARILDTSDSLFEERVDGVLVNALTKMGTSQDKEVYTGVAMP